MFQQFIEYDRTVLLHSHITLRIHRTFRIQPGIRNDTCSYSNTSSLQQNILTPTITKVIFTTVILTEQMYFLACRYTCAWHLDLSLIINGCIFSKIDSRCSNWASAQVQFRRYRQSMGYLRCVCILRIRQRITGRKRSGPWQNRYLQSNHQKALRQKDRGPKCGSQ